MFQSNLTQDKIADAIKATYQCSLQKSVNLGSFISSKFQQLSENQYVTHKMTECKQLIGNNKTATVCVGITGLVLLCAAIKSKGIKRNSNDNDRDREGKSHNKKGLKEKIFVDEELDDKEMDQPSTDTIPRQSQQSQHNPFLHRNVRYESDDESEDEKQDKIFFEMYQTYKHS